MVIKPARARADDHVQQAHGLLSKPAGKRDSNSSLSFLELSLRLQKDGAD